MNARFRRIVYSGGILFSLMATAHGGETAAAPVSASGPHQIEGNETRVEAGAQVFLEFHGSDRDPDTLATVQAEGILYVDDSASGANDGSSWCDAFVFLQDALAAAEASGGSVSEIHVGQGTHRPDRGVGQTLLDRAATFRLLDGVRVLGGYAGCGEADPDARDTSLYEATLTGDLLGDDGLDFANYGENSYHVVTYDDPNATGAVLDGFSVSHGNADGTGPGMTNQGGGIHIRNGSVKCIPGGPTIRDCIIRDNWAAHHGAVNDHGLTTVIEDCTFRDNYAGEQGAGLAVHSGSATATDSLFERNTVGFAVDQGEGGGVWLGHDDDASCPSQHGAVFTNCDFQQNHSRSHGGGAFAAEKSNPTFQDCTFNNNTADNNGGGAYMDGVLIGDDTAVFTGSTFSDNFAAVAGGGLYAERATLSDCAFLDNRAPRGGGMYAYATGPHTLEECTFVRNAANGALGGGGIYQAAEMMLRACIFRDNTTDEDGGAIKSLGGDLTVFGCSFIENGARLGGALNVVGGSQTITNCRFVANTADYGGAAYFSQSQPTVVNCLLNGNQATDLGGAVISAYSDSRFINCTLYGNTAATAGGIYSQSMGEGNNYGPVAIHNCVLRGNSDNSGMGQTAQIYNTRDDDSAVYFSNLQGWNGTLGGGNNIDDDPLFLDPDGSDNISGNEDDDFRLAPGSTSIDAGDNLAVPFGVTIDLDDRPRIDNGTVDMGPYEYGDGVGDCGNGECAGTETSCSCPDDCGQPPSSEIACNDGEDEDCDTMVDCADPDCWYDSLCPCVCNGNVNDLGGIPPVAFPDLTAIIDCANGDCSSCTRDCDVNCDGTVDFEDLGAGVCHFNAGSESGNVCCDVPIGACENATIGEWPPCFDTSEAACDLFAASYLGDGTSCFCVVRKYGDVDDSGTVSFSDISLIVDEFRGLDTILTMDDADIAPCGGNGIVNFEDISAAVDAFREQPQCSDLCL